MRYFVKDTSHAHIRVHSMPSSTTTSCAGKGVVQYQLASFREGAFAHTAATAGMAHDTRPEIASQRRGRRVPG
jgi:hypothetical protein